jgi:adenosylcobyric acid synthase
MLARTLMVQGTASSVGKSLLVTALCRMFQREGVRVAPFKSQNMALNSYVTLDGHEIGRAQAVQAEAARIAPTVDMNPILLKPEGDARSQVVVLGKPIGSMSARQYQDYKPELRRIVADSLGRLRETHDLVVIEGAGSPAEINLKARDIVNMHVARVAEAPVLLVGDIDRGGVFAAFVGTMELLEPAERARIAAFVVNKFRGDVALLAPGLDFLTKRTNVPTLGVVPHVPRLRVADEDSIALDDRRHRPHATAEEIEIAVVRLPRISNYDDFAPLEHEPGVVVRFVDDASDLAPADIVVLPGTKSTISDLGWLRGSGIAAALAERARERRPILGICGGCQMLGARVEDPYSVESSEPAAMGLEILPIVTRFERTKTTAQVKARVLGGSALFGALGDHEIAGYEIHMGTVARLLGIEAAFEIRARNGRDERLLDGAMSADNSTVGTMLHGIFEDTPLRQGMLTSLRSRRGLAPAAPAARSFDKDAEYDRVADVLGANIDRALLARIVHGSPLRSPTSPR